MNLLKKPVVYRRSSYSPRGECLTEYTHSYGMLWSRLACSIPTPRPAVDPAGQLLSYFTISCADCPACCHGRVTERDGDSVIPAKILLGYLVLNASMGRGGGKSLPAK